MRIISEKAIRIYGKADLLYLYKKFPPDPMKPNRCTSYWFKDRLFVNDPIEECVYVYKRNPGGMLCIGAVREIDGGLAEP